MERDGTIKITRLEVARRHLETAIELFFEERDPICVHTLAAAAREVLVPITRATGVEGSFLDNPLGRISPAKRKEFQKLLRTPQNFFKHGSSKPNESIEFAPSLPHFFLFDGILMFQRLYKERFIPGIVYDGWFVLNYDEFLTDDPINDDIKKCLPSEPLRSKMLADRKTLVDVLRNPGKYGF